MFKRTQWLALLALLVVSCSNKQDSAGAPVPPLNAVAQASEQNQQQLADQVAAMPDGTSTNSNQGNSGTTTTTGSKKPPLAKKPSGRTYFEPESRAALGEFARASLIAKARQKRMDQSLFRTNEKIIKAMGSHTKVYSFTGKYRVMVIPVQFSDVKFENPRFFKPGADGKSEAQDYVFGEHPQSMASYYKHVSLGNLQLEGEVTPIITVDRTLEAYGEAIPNNSDSNARGLVVDTLLKLKDIKTDDDWWLNFDNWDLSDYDKDTNFHEPDGFIDAVILIYAGKSQASCQSSFDADGSRPASADVPPGPRHDSAVECFNRIWPHRWSIALSSDDPNYSSTGPIVEGRERPAMNGLKINDNLFATDYNMQSEFSDRSTFIHEFGHSLSLPDVYSRGGANSTGSWEVMSQNANLQAQEMSSYSRISLGWLAPKIVEQGDSTSAYLGAYNFVSPEHRENLKNFEGPNLNRDEESVVSIVPDSGESVYRSIMVLTDPTEELQKVVDFPDFVGKRAAYTSRFNGESRALKFTFDVPATGDGTVSFDTIYHIETETNFNARQEPIKVVTDFDIGQVVVNKKELEVLRLVSGDNNYNTLNENNPECKEDEVLALRKKIIAGQANEGEVALFQASVAICQKPLWVKKSYDLSEFRGQEVTFEIRYVTDAGYTEFGIVVDNVKLPGGEKIDFEGNENLGDWAELKEGNETLTFNQYYLLEYRTPGEDYVAHGETYSFNLDNNIKVGNQSMFIDQGQDLKDRFRMMTYDYQPGVLAWYFNSKYERGPSGNDPFNNEGKGYLLVVNSNVGELTLPGVFSHSAFKDSNGNYLPTNQDNALSQFVKRQRADFVCFSHTEYSRYLTGEAADCNTGFEDAILDLTFEGKSLMYRRERFNETLPVDRYGTVGVGVPFRTGAFTRTGLSTFRPADSGDFAPFKVYRVGDADEMVIDEELTGESTKIAPVSKFSDKDQKLSEHRPFHGDSGIVEKKGFSFEVATPNRKILERYEDHFSGDENDSSLRRPRVKVYFDWK